MATIDADAHVIENENTWKYVDSSEQRYMPALVYKPGRAGPMSPWWAVEERLIFPGPVSETDAVKALRELEDVPGRLRHMDELDTDIQVIFPTVNLRPMTKKAHVERAICRSYNRWVAERCKEGGDRLRWALMPPTLDIEASVEELRFGKDHGACAVFWRGVEGEMLPSNPHFFPIYEEAQRLDLPICIHAAIGNAYMHDVFPEDAVLWLFKVPGITAFHNIISARLPQRFPKLRWGFIELSSQWVPYLLHDIVRRAQMRGEGLDPATVLADNRLYVGCQTDDDLGYVLSYAGEKNLVSGTDYGHADSASELLGLQRLRQREDVPAAVIEKILDDNARALYGL